MLLWFAILIPPTIVGIICALFFKSKSAIYLSGVVPSTVYLLVLFYSVYEEGEATMWPIALIFIGIVTALTGVISFILTNMLLNSINKDN